MAILSPEQAKNLCQAPKNKRAIQKAHKHELRMRMHTEPILDKADYTEAHIDFLQWVNSILTAEDKQTRFRQLFTLPLPTNDLCNNIYLEYPRALSAHNQYIKNMFTSEDAELDFKEYCEQIGFNDFWRGQGMEALKKYINAFVIVDMPVQQVGSRPEPYMYMLYIDQVIDVEVKADGTCEYIIFCQDVTHAEMEQGIAKRIAVFDDSARRTFIMQKDGTQWQPEKEFKHELGQCPAFKFYADTVSKKNRLNSNSPITSTLGDLDELLFKIIAVRYYEAYGMFPIYWGYKQDCGYVDAETNGECNNQGTITWFDVDGPGNKPHFKPCPKCAAKKLFGPGTFIEVDAPRVKEEADLREPVGYVGVDVPALENAQGKLKALKSEIIYNTTGKDQNSVQGKEAINEEQVQSIIESRTNVLSSISKNFEKSMFWGYYFLAKERYGDMYINSTVDLGKEYFLRSEEELNKDYEDTRKAGRPSFELAAKREFIYLTAYHNNPDQLHRLNIMENLEPYQDYTVQELKNLGIPQIDATGYIIKLNFYNFVKRFERENLPVVQFGSALSFSSKIQAILNTLKTYADEQINQANSGSNPFAPQDIDNPGQGRKRTVPPGNA